MIVAGPPDALNRRGIERAQSWLEEQTGSKEIRGGDYPLPDECVLAALVLLSGVSKVPRLEELKQIAVETQQNLADIEAEAPEALRDLTWSGDDDLKPLF